MTGRSRPFDIRLSVKDAEAAIAALRAFGAEGERALRRLEGASKGPTAGMRALAAAKGEASTALAAFSGRLGAVAPVLGALGPLGVAAGAGIAATSAAVIAGLSAWAPYEQQLLRVNAVLKATGSAAGLTQGQIREMAEGVAKSTLATSESALEAAAAMATFRTVAGDTFKRTLTLSQDLASVFGGDLRSATVKLAKSLEDPVRGLDSLRESGVSFTAAQKDQIKALVESGQVLKAQGVILDTLQAQVGGAGAAERGGLTGSVKGLSDAWGDLLKEIGSSSIVLGSANILLSALAGNLQVLRSFKPKAEEQAIEDRLVELELRLAKAKAAVTEARLAARQAEGRPAGGISNSFASGPSASALKGLQDQADAIKDVIEVERERLAVIRLTRKEEEDAAAAAGARAQAEQARERAGDNLKALAERIDPAVAGLKAYRDALNIVREAERQGVGSKEDLARIQAILVKAYAETQDPLAQQVRTLLDEAAALEKVGAERERLKALQSARTASPTGEVSPEERLRLERAVNDLLAARARDKNRELEDSLDLAREELRLVDALPEVRERELALLKARNDLEKEGVAIGSEEYQQRLRIAGAIADTKAATDVARQAADETARVWTHAGENIQDALRDAFTSAFDASGQKAVDFAASFKKLMLSTAAEISAAMVFRPFVGNVLSQVGAPANVVRQFAGPAATAGQGFNLGPLLSAGGSFGSVGGVPGGISAAISIYRLLNGASLTGGSAAVAKLFAGAGNALGGAELGASFGNAGLAFSSPLASIGSFGVNFLLDKLLGNRGIGSSIGSTIGGIAGSFLGPFGSIAGSALGNLLGGLFGGKASVGANANAIVNYGGGRISVGGVGADNNGDPAVAREIADAATKGVNAVLDRLGARLTGLAGAGTPSVQVGYLRGKYFSNVGGSRAEFDDAQGAIADFIRRALATATTEGINADVRRALSRGAATPEELGARIEFAQDYRSNVRRANAAGSARQAQLTGFQIAGEDGGRQALADLRKFVDQAKDVFGADSAEAGAARGAMRNRVLGLLGADDKGANRPLEGLAAELAEVRANLQGFKDALIETGDSAEEAQAKIDAAYVRRTEEARRQIDLDTRRANASPSARQAQLTGFQIAGEENGRAQLQSVRNYLDAAREAYGATDPRYAAAQAAARNRLQGLLGPADTGADRPLQGLAAELAEVRANLQGFKEALIETGDSAEEAQAKIDAAYVRRTEEARRQIDLDTRRANASPSARQAQLTGFQIAGEENGRAQLQSVRNYLDAAREAYGATDPRYAAAQAAARNRLQGLLGPADTGADRPLQGLAAELAEVRANLQGFKEALIETGDSAEEAQAKIDAAYVRRTEEARRQIGQDTRLALASPSARQAQLVGFQIAGEENGRTQLQSIRNYLDAAREAYGAGDPRYAVAMAAARSRAQGLLGASDEGADAPLDGLAAALAEVRANLQGLKDVLVETGDTAEEAQRKIDEAYVKEVRKRAKLLNEGIGSGLRSLAGNDNVDQAIALKKQIEQEGRDAAAAGIDPTALARLQNQKVSLLLSGWTESQIIAWRDYLESVGELTDDARGKLDEAANRARGREATARALTGQMVVWAGEQSVAETNLAKAKEAYLSVLNDEVSTLEQVTSSFGRFAESLGAFRRELMLSPTYSGLTATGIYQEADRQFTDIAARAQLGDVKAIEQLETISKQFLDASIAVNAKGPQYQTDLQRVLSAVGNTESLAERTFRNNEDALRVARDNLRAAQGVQTNTKSAADLLKDMRDAQAALDTARRGAAVNQLSTFQGIANDFGRDYGAAQSETERRAVYDRYAPLRDAIIGAITDLETAQRIGETWYRGDMSDSGALKLRERVYQLGGLPRFARGGAFTVGGDGGTDTTPVMFMATRGERVEVKTPAQASSDPHASARIEAGLGEMTRQLSGMNRNLKTLGDRLVALEAERSTGTYGRGR